MTYESPEYVQFFLDNLKPMEQFGVVFQKQDGTQATYVGFLDPDKKETRKVTIAMVTESGWKSFSKERVFWIGYADQCQGLIAAMKAKERAE